MNPVQNKRVQSTGRTSALANMQMPPPGQPAAGQLPDDEDKPRNAQDSLFGEVQAQFARPAALQKIRARGAAPGPKETK